MQPKLQHGSLLPFQTLITFQLNSPATSSNLSQSTGMDGKKLNKITEVVRLQQMLKKWRKLSAAAAPNESSSKSLGFLKRTLSFSGGGGGCGDIPRGCLAVCVGEEMQRFVIPTEYLSHRAFAILLREAEEEFGFEQEGVLRIPCSVPVFESILETVDKKKPGVYYY